MKKVLIAALMLSLALTAFAGGKPEVSKEVAPAAEPARPAGKYNEAPQLAELVKAGKLPPVDQRLPENPKVVKVVDSIGKYGGIWHIGNVGANTTHYERYAGYEGLIRWTPDWSGYEPNLAERYEINEAGNEFTFYLRKGVRWSDGEPWNADDLMFWYEGIILNKELTPSVPSWLHQGKDVVKLTKIDDSTVKFTFPKPNGLFMFQLAEVNSVESICWYAPQYFGQFHPGYNSKENVDKLVKEAGVSNWLELMGAKGGPGGDYWRNSEKPVLHAWKMKLAPGEAGATDRAVWERNPYYWKVDEKGNQLPYMDGIELVIVNEIQVLVLKALNGEIDMMDYFIGVPENKPVFFDNMKKGNYHFFTTTPTLTNTAMLQLNLNHRDPVKRKLFQNKDFRIGLSYAINRKEIIELIYGGEGRPHQGAPRPESPYYNERLATQYTEYDVAKANEYLDKVASKKDAEGYRLGPDGKRISVTFEVDKDREYFDILELLPSYWKAVGVEVNVRPMDRSLWEVRVRGTGGIEYDATIHKFGGGAGLTPLTDPRYFFAFDANSLYAKAWALWYFNRSGTGYSFEPEEPPEAMKRQMELYDQIKVTSDFEKQKALMKQLLDIGADNFWVMGTSTEPNQFGIVKNNFKNVPETMPWSWAYPHPAPSNPCQFYFE
jgi:peptide/nickel transport system substrate-binding protein